MFKVQLMPSRPYRGFTALELIIVLVIGFSIIGLAAGKMRDLMDSSKSVQAIDSILMLTTNIQSLNGADGYGTSGDDLTQDLIDGGLIPKSIKVTDNTLYNPWNQVVRVAVDLNDIQKFNIKYSGVTVSACSKLLKDLLPNYTVAILRTINDDVENDNIVQAGSTVKDILDFCRINNGDAVVLHLTPL